MTAGLPNPAAGSGWSASLQLGFSRRGEKTVLSERVHHGPLTVQRPFYPENVCHVYLIHPPGGVVAGDELLISANAAPATQALLTTPAAGKFYRSAGGEARQTVNLQVAAGASLEWLPQETIIYEGARLQSNMHIQLSAQARFIGWEVLALGRPAADEGFASGSVHLNWRIQHADRLLYWERQQLDAQVLQARWGLSGQPACGSLFAYPADAACLAAVQALIGDDAWRGVTLIDGLLISRALDQRADRLRSFFEAVWRLLRTEVVGQPVCPPRIWAT